MMQVHCRRFQPQSTRTLEQFKTQFTFASALQIFLKFKQAQLAQALRIFGRLAAGHLGFKEIHVQKRLYKFTIFWKPVETTG